MNKEEKNVYTNLFEYPTKIIVRLENENEKLQQENKRLKESRNKAIEKLYCYGEVFDSKILQEFQKEMINILTGGDTSAKD